MAAAPASSARRSTVSRQRYWIRRLGALAVVGVVGYAGVRAVADMVSDDSGTADADGLEITGEPVGIADDDGVATGADVAPEGATDLAATSTAPIETTTTEPDAESGEEDGPPSPSNPAMVYIVGDSDAGTFGPYLETLLDSTQITETELNYKVSSGLARPDFFNWPEELRATLPEVDPEIVVVTFGGNDAQGLSLPTQPTDFILGTPSAENEAEWIAEYQRRAGEVMDLLLEDGRKVIWVGIPNDDNPEVTARLAVQDRAAKAAAAERPEVVFVDTWARFSGRDGNWAEFVVDPRDGVGKDVRADDGFHLNVNGAEILAIDIAVQVQDALRELGAAI